MIVTRGILLQSGHEDVPSYEVFSASRAVKLDLWDG